MPVNELKKPYFYLVKAAVLATVIVSLLGYIDYITGEVSIDLLYLLCVGLVAWYTNALLGMLCVLEILFAKTVADYYCQVKIGTHLYEWNALSDVIIYVIVCLLVVKLKKVLSA